MWYFGGPCSYCWGIVSNQNQQSIRNNDTLVFDTLFLSRHFSWLSLDPMSNILSEFLISRPDTVVSPLESAACIYLKISGGVLYQNGLCNKIHKNGTLEIILQYSIRERLLLLEMGPLTERLRYLDQDNFEPGLQSDFKLEVCSVHLSGLGQTRGRPGKFQTFLFPLVHYVTH